MKKNTAGQVTNCQMLNLDGSDFSGTATVYVTGDSSSQTIGSVGSGIATNKGRGLFQYTPAQAETNYDSVTYTFTGSGAATASRHYDTTFPQTGDSFTRLGAPVGASISADVAGVQADTDNIQTRIPAALVGGRIDASVGAMAANTLTASALASDAVVEIQTGLATPASVTALLTTQMTEAYAADGVAPTVAQCLFLIQQSIGDFGIVGTTLTVNKLDGSTPAATYTLNSTTPSSRTRAT